MGLKQRTSQSIRFGAWVGSVDELKKLAQLAQANQPVEEGEAHARSRKDMQFSATIGNRPRLVAESEVFDEVLCAPGMPLGKIRTIEMSFGSHFGSNLKLGLTRGLRSGGKAGLMISASGDPDWVDRTLRLLSREASLNQPFWSAARTRASSLFFALLGVLAMLIRYRHDLRVHDSAGHNVSATAATVFWMLLTTIYALAGGSLAYLLQTLLPGFEISSQQDSTQRMLRDVVVGITASAIVAAIFLAFG
jgi:hypothetical protein